jgi:hypothetical protein
LKNKIFEKEYWMILMENLKNSELQDNNRNSPGEKSGDKQN